MSTDRDVTRIVRSWLEVGVTALPDRVLDNVLDQLPTTSQRRASWPAWRFRPMNGLTRIAAVAAALAVVAGVAIFALPKQGGIVGGLGPGSSALPPSPSPLLLPASGKLDAGTYYIAAGPETPMRLTLTVPSGWATAERFVYKDARDLISPPPIMHTRGVLVTSWIVSHVYTDICHRQGKLTSVGTTVDQLVAVLRNQQGRTASVPTDVVLGGLPAKRIDLTVPADLDVSTCDGGIIRFWPDAGPDESGGLCCSAVGSTDVVYVVSAGGRAFPIVARHEADSSAADLAELEGIVASIKLE